MNSVPRLACLFVFLVAALMPGAAWPGDEDSKPAYMIYIDPKTGKYTHEDPDTATQIVAPAKQAPIDSEPGSPLLVVAGSVLASLLVIGLLKYQRRQTT